MNQRAAVRTAMIDCLVFILFLVAGVLLGRLLGVHDAPTPDDLDHRVFRRADMAQGDYPAVTAMMRAITRLGDTGPGFVLVVLVAVLLGILARRRVRGFDRNVVIEWMVVMAGARMMVETLKRWIARDRPTLDLQLVRVGSYSFPSGHALSTAAFLTMLAILGLRLAQSRAWPPIAGIAWVGFCALMTVLIGISRIWLGVHYVTDVAAGIALGVAWAIAIHRMHGRSQEQPTSGNLDDSGNSRIP